MNRFEARLSPTVLRSEAQRATRLGRSLALPRVLAVGQVLNLGSSLDANSETVSGPHSSSLESSTRTRSLLSASLTFGSHRHSLLVHKAHVVIDNWERARMPESGSFIKLSGQRFLLISGSPENVATESKYGDNQMPN